MILVLGADGFIGSHIFQALKKTGCDAVGTTLLSDGGGSLLQADITNPPAALFEVVAQATHIICATHMGSIDECATNPAATRRVNVEAAQDILRQAHSQAVPVYLSSNMVFSGEEDGYAEDDVPDPSTEYGRQKLEMETWIQKNFSRHIIVRLTKVYGLGRDDGTLFAAWHKVLMAGELIKAIEDMVVAPVFVGDVAQSITVLVQKNESGIFHISGPVTASFFELALSAAQAWELPVGLVEKVQRADFTWQEKRPYWHTLTTMRENADFQKTFLTPAKAFESFPEL